MKQIIYPAIKIYILAGGKVIPFQDREEV